MFFYQNWIFARQKLLEEKVAENAKKRVEVQNQQREERNKWIQETLEEHKESFSQYEKQLKVL